jgi:hypothetical protein
MLERPPINREEIRTALYPRSLLDSLITAEAWKAEERIGWFVYSAGTFIGSFEPHIDSIDTSHEEFETTIKLRGAKNKLNRGTLISASTYSIPKKMTLKGFDAMVESALWSDTPNFETTKFIGKVALNEPGLPIISPSRMRVANLMETTLRGADLATEGIAAYVDGSNTALSEREVSAIFSDLGRTYELSDEYEEKRHAALMQAFQERE